MVNNTQMQFLQAEVTVLMRANITHYEDSIVLREFLKHPEDWCL